MRIFGFICLGLIAVLLLVVSYQLNRGRTIMLCIVHPEVEKKVVVEKTDVVEKILEPAYEEVGSLLAQFTGKQNQRVF